MQFASLSRTHVRLALWAMKVCILAACLTMLASAEPLPTTEGGTGAGRAPLVVFDIPAQPLEDALYAFGTVTGIEVFAKGADVAGRRSTAVKGTFAAVEALRVLLSGTGLDVQPIGLGAITLSPSRSEALPKTLLYRSYSASVQAAIVHTLCGDSGANLGRYRVAVRLWINESGIVSSADLLSSSGDPTRDRRLHDLFVGVAVGQPPPAALPQPVIMVILPRTLQDSGDCVGSR
jgi:hypothetical protein